MMKAAACLAMIFIGACARPLPAPPVKAGDTIAPAPVPKPPAPLARATTGVTQ